MNKTSNLNLKVWSVTQYVIWFVGIFMVLALIFFPQLGLLLFWNILIPVAPALFVIATGIWRNVCPLAFISLVPKKFSFSKQIKISEKNIQILELMGLILLLLIVPLRHLVLNTSGLATAIVLITVGVVSFCLGIIFDTKSSWCSSLCPVLPVEKLYGSNVLFTSQNINCPRCTKCVSNCADSLSNVNPLSNKNSTINKITANLIVGGFPGYVWGWFQVPDYNFTEGWNQIYFIYGYPFGAMVISLIIFFAAEKITPVLNKKILTAIFAASAVTLYYWFRLPNLFGFNLFPQNSILVQLTSVPSEVVKLFVQLATSIFFFWWIVLRTENNKSWLYRPRFAKNKIN